MKKKLTLVATIALAITITLAFSACGGPSPEELYSSIQKEIKTTEKYEANYFAEYYDSKDLTAAKDAAQKALDKSDEESYETVLADLQAQNEAFKEFIDSEVAKIYNAQTSEDATSEYPFGVEKLNENFEFWPAYKVSSKEPEYISGYEAETTDGQPYANIWIDSGSYNYSYEITQIETKEVDVQTKDGKIKTALVNTEVIFSPETADDYDEYTEVNGRPMYLCKNKKGNKVLLVQSYSGDDFYIPYNAQ